ncbi:hypothetical protein [Deferribacter abyssi]|uniref:hypothetical protein n=1 Tax=Deferribacter abyssi TaxID=213806 RepID=UPI003C1B26DC
MKKSVFIALFLIISTMAFARNVKITKTDFDHSKYELITMAYSYRTQPLYMDIDIGIRELLKTTKDMCFKLSNCVGIYNFEMNMSASQGGRVFYATFDLVRRKK